MWKWSFVVERERSRVTRGRVGTMARPHRRVFAVGVGMTKFERPHAKKWDYPEMGQLAAEAALRDVGIQYDHVQAVVASYCYGDPTCGQKAVYGLGMTGVPVFNVNNNCSSGSTGIMMARYLILAGYDCALAVGFEKMDHGLTENFTDRVSPIKPHIDHLEALGVQSGPLNPHINSVTSDVVKMFAYAAKEHCAQHGTKVEHFAKIASKNRIHGSQNPRAAIQKMVSPEEVLSKRVICEPLTIAMSAPTGDGGAAVVLCSEEFLLKHNLQDKGVEILAQHMCTDLPDSFQGHSFLGLCGYTMSQSAARKCFSEANMSPSDVDVIELHDCFAPNELFLYEALGLCAEGKGNTLVDSAKWITNDQGGKVCKIGDRWVVNPSGGLLSKGHPIGATGIGQCAELCWQLRGMSNKRQVPGAQVGLQQNFGIGGAAVVTLYKKFNSDRRSLLAKL